MSSIARAFVSGEGVQRFETSLLSRSIASAFEPISSFQSFPSARLLRTASPLFAALLFSLSTAAASAQVTSDIGASSSAAAGSASVAGVVGASAAATRGSSDTSSVQVPALSAYAFTPTAAATGTQVGQPPSPSLPVIANPGVALSVPVAVASGSTQHAVKDAPLIGVVAEMVTPVEAPPADLWDRIRAGYSMEDLDDPLVAKWEKYYADRPEYMARIVERSNKYMFYIVTELERRGMPLEIALLPMIESAFNPVANSSAKAAGIWQFIPSTGVNYGMKQDWWADSRRDIVAATNGALDYLSKLHGMFGDWQLALASYNWGEGSVGRGVLKAKARGKDGTYLTLDMPAETRNYLPKLQAVKNIIRHPAAFGLTLASIPNEPYFKTITLANPIDLKRAAQLAEMTEAEFVALNPAHNRPVIGGRSEYQVLMPADKADSFLSRLEANEKPRVSWMAYRTRAGDRIEALAERFGTTVAAIKSVNGIRSVAPSLPAGYHLLVPSDGPSEDALGSIQNAVFTKFPEYAPARAHKVRRGETFAGIAKRYGVKPATLAQWNRMAKPSARAGQTLYVSGPAPVRQATAKKGGRVVYVKRGAGKTVHHAAPAKRGGAKKAVAKRRR